MKSDPELSERTAPRLELRIAALEKRVNELEAAQSKRVDHRMWPPFFRSHEERLNRIENRQRHFRERTTDDTLMGIVNYFKIIGFIISAIVMIFVIFSGNG
jgi:hypothetical protein